MVHQIVSQTVCVTTVKFDVTKDELLVKDLREQRLSY